MNQTPAEPTPTEPDLARLRLQMRHARTNMSAGEREEKNHQLLSGLRDWLQTERHLDIALFLPFDGEPDIRPLVAELRATGARLALPVIDSRQAGKMRFHCWPADCQLQANRFGILEPFATQPLENIELLLAPLVAFDDHGNRLGMGSGYYDRWLAGHDHKPVFAGLAWELQRLPQLPARDWDVPLDIIFTEKGRFSFPSGQQ